MYQKNLMPSSGGLRSCVYSVLTAYYCAQYGGDQSVQKMRVEDRTPDCKGLTVREKPQKISATC